MVKYNYTTSLNWITQALKFKKSAWIKKCQQSISKMPLKVAPFLGWLPKFLIKILLKISGQSKQWKDLKEIKDSKMTIFNFKKLIKNCGLKICFEEKYFIRPSHEIRYGIKMIKANWMNIPILEEVFVSGCTFILKLKD